MNKAALFRILSVSRRTTKIDIISTEINFIGNLVGTYNDLVDLMKLTATYPLDAALDTIHDQESGKLRGRGILVLQL